jgi:hypothetical protein
MKRCKVGLAKKSLVIHKQYNGVVSFYGGERKIQILKLFLKLCNTSLDDTGNSVQNLIVSLIKACHF